MRQQFSDALKEAMKAGDKRRVSTVRLITSALKDRDIEQRGVGKDPLSDDEILGLLTKMVKQRQESMKIYEDNARPELAEQEREEIAIIMGFMPQQMDDAAGRRRHRRGGEGNRRSRHARHGQGHGRAEGAAMPARWISARPAPRSRPGSARGEGAAALPHACGRDPAVLLPAGEGGGEADG